MNSLIKIFIVILIAASHSISQEHPDTLTAKQNQIFLNNNLSLMLEDLDFYLELKSLDKTISANTDPNTKWLWTSYAISNSQEESFQSQFNFENMTRPLYIKMHEDAKFNPVRYVLGLAQTGAVGYLAYKHIKKYGFLK